MSPSAGQKSVAFLPIIEALCTEIMFELIKNITKYLFDSCLIFFGFILAAFGCMPTKWFDDDGPTNSGSDLIGKKVVVCEDITGTGGGVFQGSWH